ncbi:MAG: hypothetical protein ACP5RZ_02070 [Thermoplasmata archaeon]
MFDEIKKTIQNSDGKWVVKIKTEYGPLKIEETIRNVFKNIRCLNNFWSPYLDYGLIEICLENSVIYLIWTRGNQEIIEITKNKDFDISDITDEISSANIESSIIRLMRGQF